MTAPVTASEAAGTPGWYGKLAGLGDFAHRRLPPHWVHACDAWLAGAMRSGREGLGERWLDAYLTAPLLRFAWAPDVVDAHWWFGVLMPSCDSVGRYFPLLVAHPRLRPPEDRIALDHLELWYEHVGQAAMATLQGSADGVAALEAALHDTPPWPTPSRGSAPAVARDAAHAHLELVRAVPLSQWLPGLAVHELVGRLAGCSLWWRTGEAGGPGRVDIVRGLPRDAAFVALFVDG